MIKKSINLAFFAVMIMIGCKLNGQVTGVRMKLVYNDTTCFYDAYIHIVSGTSISALHRAQFNSSYSIVAQTGTILQVAKRYMPLKNNQTYTGVEPFPWEITSTITSPAAQPESDFHYFATSTLGTYYDNLYPGDSVRLFSLKVLNPGNNCGRDIRLFINGQDPDSNAPGMNNADFSQGFTIGGGVQDCVGDCRLPQIYPTVPTPEADIDCSVAGISFDISPIDTSCHSPYTFSWTGPGLSGASTSEDLVISTVSPANNGIYTLVVSDDLGCTASFEYELENNPNAGADQSACSGTSVTLTGSGADGSWSQSGNNPSAVTINTPNAQSTTVDFPSDASGIYKFYYSGLKCTDSLEVTVSKHDAGNNPAFVTCYEDGVATLAASGIGTWSLDLANSAGTATISPTNSPTATVTDFSQAGTYILNWINGTCEEQITISVGDVCACPIADNTINDPATNSFCSQSTNVLLTGSNPTPAGGTYLWEYSTDGVTFNPANGTNSNINYTTQALSIGEHYFRRYYTTTSGIICSIPSNNIVIVVHDIPVVTLDPVAPMCFDGGSFTLSALPGGGTFSGDGVHPTSGVFNPSDAGVGDASITYTIVDNNNCSNDAAITITVKDKPSAPQVGNDGPKCIGETINLTSDFVSNAIYSWTGPNGFTSGQQNTEITGINDLKAGDYDLTLEIDGCFSDVATTTVSVKQIPDAPGISNDGPSCIGDDIQLSAETIANAIYRWTGPNGFTSNLQYPPLLNVDEDDSGEYICWIEVDGCISGQNTTTVLVKAKPAAPVAANDSPKCPGENVNLTATDVANATYHWYGPGYVIDAQNPTLNAVTILQSGNYKVVAKIDGCPSDTATTIVTVKPTPATPTPTNNGPVCQADTLQLNTTLISGAIYKWTGPDGFNAAIHNPTVDFMTSAKAGDYKVKVTVDGCESAEGTTTVVVKSKPSTPTASNDGPKCIGEDITLSTPNVPGAMYSWRGLATSFVSDEREPKLENVTPLNDGVYWVKVIINGCESDEAQTIVIVKPKPATPVASNDGAKCTGEDITLSTPEVVSARYIWSGPNAFYRDITTPTTVIAAANATHAGVYKLWISVGGCLSDSATTTVAIKATPATPIVSNDGPKCEGETITLSTPSIANATYEWSSVINGFNETQQNPQLINATPSLNGIYKLKIKVDGCESAEASTTVTVKPKPATPTVSNDGPKCIGEDITLSTLSVSGASYEWTGPNPYSQQNPIINNTTLADNGEYKLIITVNGCVSDEASTTVVIHNKPTVTLDPVATLCDDASPVVLVGSPISGGTYNGNGVSGNLFDPSDAEAGSHVVSYTYTDINNCSNEAIINIEVQAKPEAIISTIDQLCEDAADVPLFASPTGGQFSGEGVIIASEVFRPSLLSPGNYTINYSWTDNVCSADATLDVEIRANPIVSINDVGQICVNAAGITLNATPNGGIFSGSNGIFGENFNPTDAGVGTHTITYTYQDGNCFGYGSIDIEVTPEPIAGIDAVGELCEDANDIILTGFPSGIVFSGNGVIGDVFSPSSVPTGDQTITGVYDDNLGCIVEATTIISVKEKPTVTINNIGEICETETEIELVGNPTGGTFTGAYTFYDVKFDVQNAKVGNHTVTYNYNDGVCSNSTTAVVEVVAKPVIVIDPVGQICINADRIDLTATPANGTFSGDGVESGNKFNPNGLSFGSHEISYTVIEGTCITTEKITIEVVPAPIVTIDALADICIDGATVNLTGSPFSGTFSGPGVSGFTFNPTNAGIGDHTITYTFDDQIGCVVETTELISVKAKPNVTIDPIASVCETETEINLTGNQVGGFFSGDHVSNNKFDVTVAGIGSHPITYSYNDGICSNETSTIINVIAKPVITITEVGQICKDASPITLTATPTIGIFSGDGVVSGNQFNPTTLSIGNHIVSYTVTAGACTSTETISIEVTPAPVVVIDAVNDVCIDGSPITLSATPAGVTFTGSGVSGNTFTPSVAGVGDIIITGSIDDNLGCIVESTITVSVKSKPVVTINNIPDVCETTSEITLVGNPAGGIFTGSNVINNDKFDVSTAGVGTHTITYTYSDGVCSNSANGTVNVTAKPVITITEVGQICKDASPITLTATPTIGIFSGDGVVSGNQFNPTTLSIGNHIVSYTVTAGACTSTETISIEVTPAPVVAIDAVNDVCIDGSPITLNATPAGVIFIGNGVSTNTFTPSIAGVGDITITGRIDDNLGCIVESTVTVSVKAKPVVTINNIPDVCETTPEINLVGNPAGGIFTGNNVINIDKFDVSTAGVGTHPITYTYSDGVCSNSANGTVNVTAEPVIIITEVGQICKDASPITLQATPIGLFSGDGVTGNKFNPSTVSTGNHSVSYTVTSGACTSTESISIEVVPSPVIAIDAVSNVCIDGAVVALNASPIGGTFSGNAGVSGAIFNPSIAGAGNHTITYTFDDNLGCVVSEDIQVTVENKPTVIIDEVGQICQSSNAINLTANLSPGTFSGSAAISGSSFDPKVVSPGIHTINYVYDNGICSNTGSINIEVMEQVNAGSDATLNCVIINNTSYNLQATGSGTWVQKSTPSVLPFNKNIPNPLIEGFTDPGVYSFEYSNGVCKDEVSLTISAKPDAGSDISGVRCFTTSQTALAGIGNGTWSLISNGLTADFDVNNPATTVSNFSIEGQYTFVWTVDGCTDTVNVNVGKDCQCPIENNLIASPNPKDFCDNTGSITLDGGIVSLAGNYRWQYSLNNSVFADVAFAANTSKSITISNLGLGNHRFRRLYETTSGVICADTSNIVSLDVKSKPSIIGVSSNSPVCSGEELNITALDLPGTTYKWFDNNNQEINRREINIPSASEINEGTYRLYITRDNCISDEISLNVVVNDKPATPVIEPITAICEGENLSFNTNTVAEEYQWTVNGNTVGSVTNSFDILGADLFDAGTYQLTVSNLGCESDPATVNVVVNAKPAKPVLNSNSPVCEGQNVSIVYVNNIPGVTYHWTTPNGPVNTKDINITSANSSHDGDYTLFVTKDGCTSESTTVNVEVSAKFAAPAIIGDITVCEGENIELTTDAVGADYEWTLPNGIIVNTAVVSIPIANKTIHEGLITLKISKNGCESEIANAAIVVNAIPATPSIDPISAACEGESLSFNTTTIADSYEWTFNNIVKDTNKSFDKLSADESDEGVYSLVVTINGCKSQPATVNAVINEIPAKPILSSNSPVCEGQAISIILTNNVAGLSYAWTIPGGGNPTTKDINIVSANSSHAGDYTLSVTKDNCVSEPTTINVEVSNKFSAPIILGDKEICEGQSTTLSTSADATAYEWVTPKGIFTSSTIEITNASASDAGNYTLKISKDGCESEIGTSTIVVNAKPIAPSIDPVTPVCEGETLSFNTSSIADTYSWKVNGIEKSNESSFEILDANINDAVTYTLVITKDGCESNPSNITAIIKEIPAKPTLNSNSPVCEGQTISIVHTNSQVDFNHFWVIPGGGTPSTKDISITSANASHEGDYILYVEKDGCKSESTTITVDVSDKSQAPTIVGQLEICEGQPINLSTNNAADSYVWTLPNNTTTTNSTIDIISATAVNAGTYKLEIEKDGCKSETQEVIVSINAKLSAPSIDPIAAVCQGEDIVITAELLAGATYSWTGPNNFTGQTHTINNAKLSDEGTYTLIVDKDGCKSEAATITVDVKETPAKPTINSNSPVCEGQTISIVHTNNEAGVTHFWETPNGDETSKDIVIATANSSHKGDYVLYIEKDGCKSEATTITVDVSDKSQAPTIVGQLEICEGQPINLSTSNAADNYVWTLPNNSTSFAPTIDITSATVANAGTYKLEIEKDGCKSETQEVIVSINAKLSAPAIDPINAVCEGEDITLTSNTSADTYEWTFNGNKISGSNTLTITNSDLNDVGTYSLSITKAGCKSENATINVEVKEKPEAAILNDSKVCEGTQLTITNSNPVNGVTYEWTLPNGTKVTDPTILIISSSKSNEGTYSLILSKDGCKSESESMLLTVNKLPETTINGDLEYCEGERISLASSNTSSLSYNWNGPDNLKETTSTIAVNNAGVSNSGSYSLQVINLSTGCISSPVEVEVTVNAKPAAPAISAEEEVCAGKEIILTAEEVKDAVYSWNGPDGFTSNVRNPIITKATEDMAGEYQLIITVNGCPSEPVTLAIAIKNCSCNIADNEITSDLSAFCNESGAFTIEATTPIPSDGKFEWQYKDDKSEYAPATGVNDLSNYDVDNLGLGKHFFRRIYTIENEGYVCTDTTETLELNVLDNSTDYIDLLLDPKAPCVGDTMTILIENEIPGVAYTWTVLEDDMSIVASNNRLAQFSPDKSGKYHVQVTQQIPGCNESEPLVQEINVFASPRVNLGNDTVFCSLDGDYEINLNSEFAAYTWNDGSENSNLTIDTKGTYTVTVTDENGCEGIDEIRIKEFCCKIYYPNIVNMVDGAVKNNEFKLVDNGCVLSSKLRIYDRWGNLVYNSNSGLEPWNGLFKGKPVEQGVYAFIFTYTALDEDDEEFTGKLSGDVTILR